MTVEAPPATVTTPATAVADVASIDKTAVKNVSAEATEIPEATTKDEQTLSIQIEPKQETEDLGEEKPASPKRKPLFNNPFKITKKEVTSPEVTSPEVTNNKEIGEDKTTSNGENKITKGLGNLYTKIKQTASSHNIKDIVGTSPPAPASAPATTPATQPVLEDEQKEKEAASSSSSSSSSSGDEAATAGKETDVAPTSVNNNKRQSLLSKLFGGSKKKEDEPTEADQTREVAHETDATIATPTATVESEERPASPPLSRRVTGFFAKKMPSYNKKHQKSSEKVESTTEDPEAPKPAAAVSNDEEPQNATKEEGATGTQQSATPTAIATAAESATGVTTTDIETTNKDAPPATTTA